MILMSLMKVQSSTLVKINYKSNYFKRKQKLLKFFSKEKNLFFTTKINIKSLDNFLKENKIDYVEILKIDTEGYDFNVIKSLGDRINCINYIYFEHHFHDMLNKDYTYMQVHNFLVNNGFKKTFKSKMFYRKTFEYIYKNTNININEEFDINNTHEKRSRITSNFSKRIEKL